MFRVEFNLQNPKLFFPKSKDSVSNNDFEYSNNENENDENDLNTSNMNANPNPSSSSSNNNTIDTENIERDPHVLSELLNEYESTIEESLLNILDQSTYKIGYKLSHSICYLS